MELRSSLKFEGLSELPLQELFSVSEINVVVKSILDCISWNTTSTHYFRVFETKFIFIFKTWPRKLKIRRVLPRRAGSASPRAGGGA